MVSIAKYLYYYIYYNIYIYLYTDLESVQCIESFLFDSVLDARLVLICPAIWESTR